MKGLEWRLLRLVRCLNKREIDDILQRVARAALDKNSEKFPCVEAPDPSNQSTEAETDDAEKYEWFLLDCFWRVKTAAFEIHMLRDYDHPFWESFFDGAVEYVLFGDSSVDNYAQALAEYYIAFCNEYAVSLQSEFAELE